MRGLFTEAEIARSAKDEGRLEQPSCGACGLSKQCRTPKMRPTGRGRRGVLVVAEAPGAEEDDRGVQLVGKTGREFRRRLSKIGIDLDRDCWKTNAVICRPPDNKIEERHIESCRPNLIKTVEELRPSVIILLGASAIKSLVTYDWGKKPGRLESWVGWRIPSQRWNAWICPTWHPSFIDRMSRDKVLGVLFDRHLKNAFELDGPPWTDPPDYESRVKTIKSPGDAAKAIRGFLDAPMAAFDYETDRLKPDHSDRWLVSCAISDGARTIAYPWEGKAVEATREFLRSPVRKIGANIKFEERWTRRVLRCGVKNWHWDTVNAAHTLNNAKGVTSVEFQAYVRLGLPAYGIEVKPYLEAESGNAQNQIRNLGIEKLLFYNGMDALVEYLIAVDQMSEMGIDEADQI